MNTTVSINLFYNRKAFIKIIHSFKQMDMSNRHNVFSADDDVFIGR